MVPGSRPLMTLTDTARPDFVIPPLIAANPRALEIYSRAMERAWAAKNRLLDMGVPLESRSTCCPTPRRCASTRAGPLLYLAHKWVMRTCFNAQEEIYRASMDELDAGAGGAPAARAAHGAALRAARRAASRRPAPRASTSAACPSGATSRTSSARCRGLLPSHAPEACPTCAARQFRLWPTEFAHWAISPTSLGSRHSMAKPALD